jgi:CubicO group peptidase (beta-lactamase class C family)
MVSRGHARGSAGAGKDRRLWGVVVAVFGLVTSGCILPRMVYFNAPSLEAPDYFDRRDVAASRTPHPLPRADAEAELRTPWELREHGAIDDLLHSNETRAFLVIKDDQVIYERYFDGITEATQLPGFSISKTFAAALVGCAIEDGLIPSTRARLVDFVPELAPEPGYAGITIEHLLRMTSGISFDEASFAGVVFYYSQDLRDHMYSFDVTRTPGTHYLYGSINTQLLWDVLHRRLGGRSVSSYFQERIWDALGADRPAMWSLDSADRGVEKFAGGFAATARDQARLGLLYLHGGRSRGKQVVPEAWVRESLATDPVAGIVETADGRVRRGKYQWFVTLDRRAFFAKGYDGQYVFVVPEKNLVFVRFGEGYGDVDWPTLFMGLADAMPEERPLPQPPGVAVATARLRRGPEVTQATP